MGFKQRAKNSVSAKSPSTEAMKKTAALATLNGGVTQDFAAHVENIRDTSKLLGYNIVKASNPVRRNLLRYSDGFDNTAWNKINGINVVSNQAIAPDGTLTADKLLSTGTVDPWIQQYNNVNGIANKTFTFSVWVWSDSNINNCTLFIYGTTVNGSGTEEYVPFYFNSTTIPTRYTLTKTFSSLAIGPCVLGRIDIPDNSPNGTYIYVWGAQLEEGPLATKYQPTQEIPIDGDYTNANFLYVPSSYGEGKNFSQSNLRNLLKFSEEFDNASIWRVLNPETTITPNYAASPIGTITADRLLTSVNNEGVFSLEYSILPSTNYTMSVYLKGTGTITLGFGADFYNDTNSAYIYFNLNTKSFTGIDSRIINYGFVDVGDGWIRLFSTTRSFSLSSKGAMLIYHIVGTGPLDTLLWGAQLEQSPIPTFYQRTTDDILDFNFTRATNAIVTNELGIIEDSCYNLAQRSEEFDNAFWGKIRATITSNIIIAPNGTLTADKLVENTVNDEHNILWYKNGINETTTFSVYAKAGERNWLRLQFGTGTGTQTNAWFNLTTGQKGNIDKIGSEFSNQISNIKDSGNGWYLCSFTATKGNSLPINAPAVHIANNNSGYGYQGDGVSGFYIWGAQLTQGSELRPYLRTTNRLNVPKLEYTVNQRNMLKYSEEFDNNTFWLKTSTTVSATTNINAFNINKSYYLIEDTLNAQHFIRQSVNVISGTTYTASIYVKKSDDIWIQFLCSASVFSSNVWANFNFDTGLFGNKGNLGIWTSKLFPNGYWMISVTATATLTSSGDVPSIAGANNINTATRLPIYTGTSRKICEICAIQFERGSVATPYAKTTNIPVSLNTEASLLIEPQRTNLMLQSENPNNWNSVSTTVSSEVTIAPSNTLTADKMISTSVNDIHARFQTISGLSTASTYTFSIYIKAAEYNYAQISIDNNGRSNRCFFIVDLLTGLITNGPKNIGTGSPVLNSSVQYIKDGWYRCSISAIPAISNPNLAVWSVTEGQKTADVPTYLGDDVSGIYIWGAQLELGSNATSYIPTTTATISRNGETSYIDLFNNNTLNKNNWSLHYEGYLYDGQRTGVSICLSDDTNANGVGTKIGWLGQVRPFFVINNSFTNILNDTTNNSYNKFIVSYDNGTAKFFRNGISLGSFAVPVFDYRYLLVNNGGSTFTVDKCEIFNRNLSDADCILLTTL